MKQFVYIGGVPRTGTTGVASFIHLHDDAFIYLATRGAHPGSNPSFYTQLISRHKVYRRDYTGAQFLLPPDVQEDPEYWNFKQMQKYHKICELKNVDWGKDDVDRARIVGIREDFALNYFPNAKKESFGRNVRLIFTVRLDLSQLFISQFVMGKLHMGKIPERTDLFIKRMTETYTEAWEMKQKYPDDVLVVSVVDGEKHNWRRIIEFLDLSPTPEQEAWMDDPPVTNTFGASIRRAVAEVEQHTMHKYALAACERYSSI